ncbi:Crp/Fnr family transcriptional regulator [Paenibacillus thalictri]|uniref:Crp/Fnr family transcriptional regulator n=1 Tax=Paenibacillus thalictri TaxID=2527873 RepID=A0A4Q9DSJ3_9BACL|nr:Crp/Fnr family transcriptional regulator [Paenibacillus thalictri]TBL78229.1 Crp/Fnr family transcriptional regulator [Paenibacillus thalictri]
MPLSAEALFTAAHHRIADFLSEEHFSRLQQVMQMEKVAEGQRLFWEGELADRCFYVSKGIVKVSKTTEDGRELILQLLFKGGFFAEIGGFGDVNYSCTAEVLKSGEIGIVTQQDLDGLIYQYGGFAVQFMKWMGLTHRTMQSKIRDLMLFGKPGALASTLIRLANSHGDVSPEGIRIKLKLTHVELANMIGATRESVNRMLSSFREEGKLSIDNGYMVIHDLGYFKNIVKCPDCPPEICRF